MPSARHFVYHRFPSELWMQWNEDWDVSKIKRATFRSARTHTLPKSPNYTVYVYSKFVSVLAKKRFKFIHLHIITDAKPIIVISEIYIFKWCFTLSVGFKRQMMGQRRHFGICTLLDRFFFHLIPFYSTTATININFEYVKYKTHIALFKWPNSIVPPRPSTVKC